MSLFDLVINIIESSIMCYFIYKYFDFKQMEKLWLFILVIFTTLTVGNSFINKSSVLLIIVISALIVCLKIFGEKIRIESIIICFLSLVIDIVCNVVSLIIGRIANYFIGTQFIQMPAMTVLSKILYLIAIFAFLKKKTSYKSQLNSKRWITLIIVISILLIVVYILVTSYVFDNVDALVNLFCTALIFIAIILILNIYGKILEENEESTRIRLKNEEIRYKKENEKVLSKMSEDIYQLEHNLRYILMQVKINEENKKYDENIELIDQYIRNFGKFKAIINTDNPYFDYFMNQKINDLSNNGIDVHTSINIYEKQGFNIIEVLTSKNMKLTFDNSFKQLAQHLDAQYKVTQDNELCVFKSIQSMK